MCYISALMPVYNGENHIKETIESILYQTYKEFEFIIINDGSTDNTQKIIEKYKDKRIKLYNLESNKGVGFASNFALNKAKGKYIARVDSDDIYHKDRFRLQKNYLDSHPEIVLVKTLIEYFGDNKIVNTDRYKTIKEIVELNKNKVVSTEEISKQLYWNMCIPHTSVMARTKVLKEFGYTELRCCEDYYLCYNMNKKNYKMATINEHLVKVRITNESTTAQNRDILYKNIYIIKKDIINNLFLKGKVYIWGAGSFGKLVYNILREYSLPIEGFIDRDTKKQNILIDGLRVYSPNMITGNKTMKIIIASQPGTYSIINYIENIGYKHIDDYLVYF
ncbi:glycosyl transferase family 2 [Natranaerovirga pectinivora]|uniref:Glycosyl transferase family 2 n=1 Tax=Natranaerovirga pectinivora TaxID=682400 RepID=A0A4V2V057_9FIRM|nr:glycosyltransferase [Natranaerovirga pectinivora]TCT14031.1 glycosyl transferase family 2 [Natranaerovirga pectinivora]